MSVRNSSTQGARAALVAHVCLLGAVVLLARAWPAAAQATVVRPQFLLMVDNSGSMWARTASGTGQTNSCGLWRTRINDVACVVRNVADGVGDATFGMGMFRTQCTENATVNRSNGSVYASGVGWYSIPDTAWSCGGATCTNTTSAPSVSAFPSYPFPIYGCPNAASVVVPLSNARRNDMRNWGDGVFTSCTAYVGVGQTGGPELAMRRMTGGTGTCSSDSQCVGICEGGSCYDGANTTWTPLAGSMRASLEYLSGSTGPYRNVEGTSQPDPYAACRPVSVVLLTDGEESCANTVGTTDPAAMGDALNAANIGCLQVDLNGNGTFEDPIPNTDPNPALRGRYERNRDLNGDGDCFDAGEQRAFRTKVYPVFFGNNCNSVNSIERVGLRGGVAPHSVACAPGQTRYGYYARSEEEVAQAINQIVSDSQLIETCNSLDDDCDQQIDEGFPVGSACSAGVGACLRSGTRVCSVDGQGTTCTATAAAPGVENSDALCDDGADNDCDGFVDCADPNCATARPCTITCAPSSEICDGRDNDCDSQVDEGGFTRACGSAIGVCVPGLETCQQQQGTGTGSAIWMGCTGTGPMSEVCNGLDEDCNGIPDDHVAVGAACGPTTGVCRQGQQQCVGGRTVCVGGVPAQRELCDCLDNDCDGTVDENPAAGQTICPGQSVCLGCQCVLPCQPGSEFGMQCPAGRLPEVRDGMCYCVSPPCDATSCAQMTIEQGGQVLCAPGRDDVVSCQCELAGCIAPCAGRVCENGTVCDLRDPQGRCVENNCRGLGCSTGEICDVATGVCMADRCAGVMCAVGQACRNGACETTCAGVVCPSGQRCAAGRCEVDACASVTCATGQQCVAGACVQDRCLSVSCRVGEVCDVATGNCVQDPCLSLRCPTATTCVRGECVMGMPRPTDNTRRVSASGGSGCAVRPVRSSPSAWLVALGLTLFVLWSARGKKNAHWGQRAKNALVFLGIGAALVLSGCKSDSYCLNCQSTDARSQDASQDRTTNFDTSVADTGPVECVPGAAELCNRADDDCDGMVDEGVDIENSAANCGGCGMTCAPNHAFGRCTNRVCSVGQCDIGFIDLDGRLDNGCEYTCLQQFNDDSVCNRADDDCDGRVDENVMVQSDPLNCGMCGTACTYANARGACGAGVCMFSSCLPGFYNFDSDPSNGCEAQCSPASGGTEICNGIDDDCDNRTDESVAVPSGFVCRSQGACAGATASCMGALGWRCSYGSSVEVDMATGQPVALELRCDNIDGNCNGAADETFTNLRQSCDNGGVGACGASGVFACNSAGTDTACNAPAVGTPAQEIADGLDNDCDGVSDEPRSSPGTHPSFVATNWIQYAPNEWVMQYEASRPDATASAQGALSTRACSRASVLPWTNLRQQDAAAACTAAGARLCTETEWQTVCQGTSSCTWAWQTSCNTYQTNLCNTADYATSPSIRTGGALSSCYAAVSGGSVFDMSGNVREFTEARSTGAIPVRGGSYTSNGWGAQCTNSWSVVGTSYRFDNVGFRCCYSGSTPP